MKKCPCGMPPMPGLVSTVALCQKHYSQLMFGNSEDHKEGLRVLRMNYVTPTPTPKGRK